MSALKAVLEVIRAGYVPIRREDYESMLNDIDRLENECKRLKDENAVLRSCAVTISDDGNVWNFGTLVDPGLDVTVSVEPGVSPTVPGHAKPTC